MKNQPAGRKLFSVGEAYMNLYYAFCSMPSFRHARKTNLLSEEWMERIMLAVTEVNKCAMCSYAHTKIALEAGLEKEEIRAMLAGDLSGAKQEELAALLFAQHYADTRGKPSAEAWQAIVEQYGYETGLGILGAIRMITVGNTYGIPSGNLLSRLTGRPLDPRSRLGYELAMLFTLIPFLPCAALQALAAGLLRQPVLCIRE